jgi:RNA polymerase sporulation-specific sigma factor
VDIMSTQTVSKLTNEELFALYLSGDQSAKEELAESNSRLVHYIAKGFISSKIPYDELYRNGLYGLVKAIHYYKLDKNTKFATFATRCIQNEILMFIRNERKHKCVISLYEPAFENGKDKTIELIETLATESNEDLNFNIDVVGSIFKEVYMSLSTRDQLIVKAIIIDEKNQTEVAKRFNLAQSYISRIVKAAKEKMRKLAIKEGLFQDSVRINVRNITEDQYLELKKVEVNGKKLTEKEIAVRLKITPMTLWNKKSRWKQQRLQAES